MNGLVIKSKIHTINSNTALALDFEWKLIWSNEFSSLMDNFIRTCNEFRNTKFVHSKKVYQDYFYSPETFNKTGYKYVKKTNNFELKIQFGRPKIIIPKRILLLGNADILLYTSIIKEKQFNKQNPV